MRMTKVERVQQSRAKRYGIRDSLKAAGKGMRVRGTPQDDGSMRIEFISTDDVEARLRRCCEDYDQDYSALLQRLAFYAAEHYLAEWKKGLGGLRIN